ncbi:MAG: phosphotransferase [Planctomycetaceae bacterium]
MGCELRIIRRARIASFQHELETVHVALSNNDQQPQQIELFVRIYRGQICWCDVARCDLPEREWAAWRIAQRAGIPLPHTYWHGWFDDVAVAVQQKMPDKTLWQVRNPLLIRQSSELLATLHKAHVNEKDRAPLADMCLSSVLERLNECAAESRDDLSIRSVRFLRTRSADIQERPAVFLHGDYHPGNLFADGRRLTAVIDWEDSSCGDPRFDLATMDTYLRRCHGLGGWLRRKETNRLADLFLESYRDVTGWNVGPLQFWKRLLDVGSVVVARWIKHRAKLGLPYPRTEPRIWYRVGNEAENRVRRWADST